MILGRDLLDKLGIDIKFSTKTIAWNGVETSMRDQDTPLEALVTTADSPGVADATDRIRQILEAKYEAADLDDVVAGCTHLTADERTRLKILLLQYQEIFDGALGKWKGEQVKIHLKPEATPYHARAFPIPRIHEKTLRMEVERLCRLGVLRKVNRSEWAAPTFIIPKKDGTVRFISDFRELNKRIKRHPFPVPKIQDLMLKLEGFKYATSLDLNMGYYHLEIHPESKHLCTIVLPWGKYEYQKLPIVNVCGHFPRQNVIPYAGTRLCSLLS